jgi:hypothetical protein
MIHHSYRDLLNKDSLKIFNVKKKNVQCILWKPAPHEHNNYCMTAYRKGGVKYFPSTFKSLREAGGNISP